MVCDLCNAPVTANDGTRISALVMRSAVLRGFNAFTTPGISNPAARTLELLGVGVDGAAADWRERALNDASDWMLCPECNHAFSSRFGGSAGSAR